MAEEQSAPEPAVRFVSGDLFEAVEKGLVNKGCVPFSELNL
jgi:hypothetical protein